MVEVSVIVPTYNRRATLLRCLRALEEQTLGRSRFEIIVVDDGSTDGTEEAMGSCVAKGVHYARQENGGPAKARNVGIQAARGDLLVFIGDDIITTPQFLSEHVSAHQHFGASTVAILGLTEWSEDSNPSPLMTTEGLGTNFEYHKIARSEVDPYNLPFTFFYTSNVSIRRSFMWDNHLLFDPDFPIAMGEDGEVAYRMQKAGLRLIYHPKAHAYHSHHLTFDNICRRWYLRGQIDILICKKHPEMCDLGFLRLTWKGKVKHMLLRSATWLLSPLLRYADHQQWSIQKYGLYRWYKLALTTIYFRGQLLGVTKYHAIP